MNQPTTQHTPGPWIVCETCDNDAILSIEQDRAALVDEEPSIIGEIDLQGEGIDPAIGAANARLIAACPTMYDYIAHQAQKGDTDAKALIATIHGTH